MNLKFRRFQNWLYSRLEATDDYRLQEVADKIGCEADALYRWSNGTGGYFPVDLISKLIAALREDDAEELIGLLLRGTGRQAVIPSSAHAIVNELDQIALDLVAQCEVFSQRIQARLAENKPLQREQIEHLLSALHNVRQTIEESIARFVTRTPAQPIQMVRGGKVSHQS